MARSYIPDLAVSTDIIVGFPGETEEDFQQTMAVVAEARYDQAFTFLFSPRPGTAAAQYTDSFVEPEVAQDRYERLIALQNQISLESNQQEVSKVLEILVEGPSRKDSDVAAARSRGNKMVHVAGHHPSGTFLQTRIDTAAPHHLFGTVL
jgi:tRNA-2-methylthio-N6-dimethylallyladenosine synthase